MPATNIRIGLVYLALALLLFAWAGWGLGWWLLLLWPAASMLVVAAGYLGLGPSVFGKQPDGSVPWWIQLFLLPYLAAYWGCYPLVFLVNEWLRGERPADEIAPGIYAGRRPAPHEIPPDVVQIVDLTCEYPVPPEIAAKYRYRTLPILDGTVPPLADLAALVEELAASPGPLLIHCAIGHGRTGLVACALLLARGLARDPEEAVQIAKEKRPFIHLNSLQRALLDQFARETRLSRDLL